MRWTYLQLLSTSALLDLHRAIQQALTEDDQLPDGEKKYGVREFGDFRQEADEIEQQLRARGREFAAIAW